MSLCDKCFSPGACCKRLSLSTGGGVILVWDDEDPVEQLKDRMYEPEPGRPMPFVPLEGMNSFQDPDGRSYSSYWWKCTQLLPNGRCGVYENRPELCRSFEPGSGHLCVHYNGAESGDPTFDGALP